MLIGRAYDAEVRGHAVRRVLASAAVVIATAALTVGAAASAQAHAQLIGSDPRDGADLAAAPAFIRLTFSESLVDGAVAVVAVDSTGAAVTLPDPRVDGPVVEVTWPPSAVGDTFTISYRVVSVDGHPITGQIGFSVAAPPSPSPTSSPTASPTVSPTPPPGPTPTPAPSPSPTPDPAPSRPVLTYVLGGLALLALAGVVTAATLRSRRQQ